MRSTLTLTLGALLLTIAAGAQTSPPSTMQKDDLFAGTEKFAKNASDVTELNMDPQSLSMVQGKDAHRAHRMVLNVVRTYEYDKPGMYNIADVEEIRNRLNTGDWHCSVHTRDSKHGESTDICNKSRNDGLVETAIITVEPKELTFIHTIRQGSGEGGGGMSETFGPLDGPSGDFHAQMAIMRAEMAEQMAIAKPELAAQMAELGPQMRAMRAEQQPDVAAEFARQGIARTPHVTLPSIVLPPVTVPEPPAPPLPPSL